LELAPNPIRTHYYAVGADIPITITLFIADNYSGFFHLKLLIACYAGLEIFKKAVAFNLKLHRFFFPSMIYCTLSLEENNVSLLSRILVPLVSTFYPTNKFKVN
jgi:hypothetical protein